MDETFDAHESGSGRTSLDGGLPGRARAATPYGPHSTHLTGPHPTGGYDEIRQWPNGNTCYLVDELLHREDGPAFIGADGSATWLRHGREHRDDGPAVYAPDGTTEFWIEGRRIDRLPRQGAAEDLGAIDTIVDSAPRHCRQDAPSDSWRSRIRSLVRAVSRRSGTGRRH